MKKSFVIPMAIAGFIGLLAGCAVPGSSSPSSTQPGASPSQPGSALSAGTVEIRVTDAPRTDNVTEIWVKVTDVQIHKSGSGSADNSTQDNPADWITANITGPNPFELLALKNSNGLQQLLAGANLTAGNYTQIRFNVDTVQVKVNGVLKDAEVPSGKLKFVEPFEVVAGQNTVLVFDFNADQMVNVTGNGKILVKPVIKLTVQKPNPRPTQ